MTKVRPMVSDDVAVGEEIWFDAFTTMRAGHGLPFEARSPELAQRTRGRISHLLASDPGGSWVAEDGDGRLVGLTQALVREDLWVLSMLGVSPRSQEKGTGKALLDAALAYGSEAPGGIILSSQDPRAMRRYCQAGFDLHPCVTARGRVDRRQLGPVGDVRPGNHSDFNFVADLDRRIRGRAARTRSRDAARRGLSPLDPGGEGLRRGPGGGTGLRRRPGTTTPPPTASAHVPAIRGSRRAGGHQLDQCRPAVGHACRPRRRLDPEAVRPGHDTRDVRPAPAHSPSGAFASDP